jgi:hypothetical protein
MPYQQKRGARQLRQSSRTKPASPPFFVPREHFVSPLRHHHATPRPGAASTLCGFQRGDRGRRRFIPVPKFRPQAPVRRSSLTKRTTRISGWSWQASGASGQSKAKELGAPPESVAQIIDAVTLGIIRTGCLERKHLFCHQFLPTRAYTYIVLPPLVVSHGWQVPTSAGRGGGPVDWHRFDRRRR